MDNETKVTYIISATLIILLGCAAYFLQPVSKEDLQKVKEQTKVQKKNTETLGTISLKATTTMEQKIFTSASITTNKGIIEITFATNTPKTVENFGKLALSSFYDGVRFHRVIKNFMIQTGDPLSKDLSKQDSWGTGGPNYRFQVELTGDEKYPLGTIAMANSGPNTNGSQFFIVTANPGYPLPPSYTVFGHVTKGIETALAIQEVRTSPNDRPLEDIIIEKVEVR
jgi:cyclophilin family peptidyl-prolyl cis-trans isomerase